ncbi:MFS transporter [Lactiplantibacillus pentosus]|uniref:MFS transporter n=1 Tax=Lactiplantibacillus pentosus TaxID=1589 RepID=UPI001C1F496A|nr:MFS transporter [Lactiplantibacillus pentosus]MBU7502229.1 MFS transporter [Lactiplantibacillus pentosus]MDY1543766.1 MFS transporter [Lactiplantibacillus pentosus]
MTSTERFKTTICLYLNYLVHGMAIVILAQNMTVLSQQWHVSDAGVSLVISSLGIGRLLVLYLAGTFSDRLGRKLFVQIGILTYTLFFIGIIVSPNIIVAYFSGILAGMANSFLDSGTYPALMELYPKRQATANIMIKAFASIGELLLPIIVAGLDHFELWYGWSFLLCIFLMVANFIFLRLRDFPKLSTLPASSQDTTLTETASKPGLTLKKLTLGIVLTIFGYISMATFYLVSQWLTKYGSDVIHLNLVHARMLVSVYSVGSILGVVVTAVLVERIIKPVWFMLIDTIVSLLALLAVTLIPTWGVALVSSFVIGCSAAGGVMQLGLTIMSDTFPRAKGRITGIYYTASGLASFTIPVFTAWISQYGIHDIMWFDVMIAVIGVICSIVVLGIGREKRSVTA